MEPLRALAAMSRDIGPFDLGAPQYEAAECGRFMSCGRPGPSLVNRGAFQARRGGFAAPNLHGRAKTRPLSARPLFRQGSMLDRAGKQDYPLRGRCGARYCILPARPGGFVAFMKTAFFSPERPAARARRGRAAFADVASVGVACVHVAFVDAMARARMRKEG